MEMSDGCTITIVSVGADRDEIGGTVASTYKAHAELTDSMAGSIASAVRTGATREIARELALTALESKAEAHGCGQLRYVKNGRTITRPLPQDAEA